MNFVAVECDVTSETPSDLAKIVYSFFQFQHEQSIKKEICAQEEYHSALDSNENVKKAYNTDPDIVGWGGGPKLPYNEYQLQCLQAIAGKSRTDRADAKKLLNFVVNRLLSEYSQEAKN